MPPSRSYPPVQSLQPKLTPEPTSQLVLFLYTQNKTNRIYQTHSNPKTKLTEYIKHTTSKNTLQKMPAHTITTTPPKTIYQNKKPNKPKKPKHERNQNMLTLLTTLKYTKYLLTFLIVISTLGILINIFKKIKKQQPLKSKSIFIFIALIVISIIGFICFNFFGTSFYDQKTAKAHSDFQTTSHHAQTKFKKILTTLGDNKTELENALTQLKKEVTDAYIKLENNQKEEKELVELLTKIKNELNNINSELKELDEEQKILIARKQEWLKIRKELTLKKAQLENELKNETNLQKRAKIKEEIEKIDTRIKEIDKEIFKINQRLELIRLRKNYLETRKEVLIKKQTQIENRMKQLQQENEIIYNFITEKGNLISKIEQQIERIEEDMINIAGKMVALELLSERAREGLSKFRTAQIDHQSSIANFFKHGTKSVVKITNALADLSGTAAIKKITSKLGIKLLGKAMNANKIRMAASALVDFYTNERSRKDLYAMYTPEDFQYLENKIKEDTKLEEEKLEKRLTEIENLKKELLPSNLQKKLSQTDIEYQQSQAETQKLKDALFQNTLDEHETNFTNVEKAVGDYHDKANEEYDYQELLVGYQKTKKHQETLTEKLTENQTQNLNSQQVIELSETQTDEEFEDDRP
ncbi:ATP-binding protein [Candidatus Phytoplasma meliae]|uniref:Uncharacterized protein n=1 Tax=Candidatus Phytoplasma meliae TaxID=1848402 RepID=A0ABS5CXD2_9MOLU|nr:hypothetical protein [Candidatus Phytoplasma meliae]MBP5835637.1 hypothetical protein [Candidatus Phytoplasma meliae]